MIQIDQEELHINFEKHLAIENNNRILFSGPFGTGKSTMLEKFFNEKTENYFVCKLLPINYSVASNEDVFELIKYDLLSYLMTNFYDELNLQKEDFSLLLRSQIFIMEKVKFMPLLYAILGMSDKIGKPATKLLEVMEKVIKDFKTFSKEIKIEEEEDIQKFLNNIKDTKGSIYEMDSISRLINDLLMRLKARRENTKSILIIDDLDRLDPDHIFRLFNIFSSQENDKKGINKFGFDKVIFVCDIENIRKIFHHKYGDSVDFLGYIDKFYSIYPFDFDNRKYVRLSINEFIDQIEFTSKFYDLERNERFRVTLTAIFISFIEAHILNLRILEKNKKFIIKVYYYGDKNLSSNNSPLIGLFQVLKALFGAYEITKLKLIYLYELYDKETYSYSPDSENNSIYSKSHEDLVSYCIPFLMEGMNISNGNYDDIKSFYCEKYKCYIHYNDFRERYATFKNYRKATLEKSFDSEEVVLNPYQLLLDTYEICMSKGYLR